MSFSTILFSLTGRLNRAPYWLAGIGLFATGLILFFITLLINRHSDPFFNDVFLILILLLLIWVGFALTTKRLHDRDKSAWWVLLFYVAPSILEAIGEHVGSAGSILSLIGGGISIWGLIELGFLRGTTGQNSYGPDPLQVRLSVA